MAMNMFGGSTVNDFNIQDDLDVDGDVNVDGNLTVIGTSNFTGDVSGVDKIEDDDASTSITTKTTAETIIFTTNSTEVFRIDSGGQLDFDLAVFNSDSGNYQFGISSTLAARLTDTALYLPVGRISLTNDFTGAVIDTSGTDLILSTNTTTGQDALVIVADGSVGLGTLTPSSDLHIYNDIGAVYTKYSTPTTGLTSSDGFNVGMNVNDKALLLNFENTSMDFYTNNDLKMTIDNVGCVGIGTDTPAKLLEIADTNPTFRFKDTRTSSGGADGTEIGGMEFWNEDVSGNGAGLHARILTIADGGSTKPPGKIVFETYNNSVLSGSMCFDSGGRLGIGSSNPSTTLEVFADDATNGQILSRPTSDTGFDGIITVRGVRNATTTALNSQIRFENYDDDIATTSTMGLISGQVNNSTTNVGDLILHTSVNGTSLAETMRLTSVGNVECGNDITCNNDLFVGTQLFVGRTTEISAGASIVESASGSVCLEVYRPTTGTGADLFKCYSNVGGTETNVALIEANGDFESATNSYGGISDIRLKENIVDCNSQWEDMKNIRFVNYDMIKTGENHIGVVANELELVCPSLVNTTDHIIEVNGVDMENIKTVKSSIMYMKGMKALQEALLRIEALESANSAFVDLITTMNDRITALEV